MSGYTASFSNIYTGPLSGEWPAGPVYVTLLCLADPDGRVEWIHKAITGATGWPDELLRKGITELERAGLLTRLFDHLDWGWMIPNYREIMTVGVRLPRYEWAELRRQVFERDDYTCRYCGTRGGNLECDHMHPVSRGGSNHIDNLATACKTCNRTKRDKTADEWLQ